MGHFLHSQAAYTMGIVLSCCASLACSCCIGLSCQCFGQAMTITKSIATRVLYTTVFILLSLVAWIFSMYGYEILRYIPYIGEYCYEGTCGAFSVYRITFALFLFHLILSIFLIGVRNAKDIRAQFNDGWWPLKLPALLMLLVGVFFIPNIFFTYYAWVAIIGAGLFILIQLIILVDFAYSWSESWVSQWQGDGVEEEGENRSYLYALISITVLLYIIAGGFDVFMYSLFCTGDCWWNSIIVTVVLLMCLFLSVCSIHPRVQEFNPRAGLLQAAIFTVYCSYYTYSAILSEPECGELPFSWSSSTTTTSDYLSLVFGGLFTIISVVYASVRAGTSELIERNDTVEYSMLTEEEQKEEALAEEEDEIVDDELQGTSYNYAMFHLAFALGAMYVGMLLTNWSVITGEEDTPQTDSGWVSVAVKLLSCGLAGCLYLWTVFAPAIMKDRDWD